MRILGFIPARGGSKGVPGKNKKLLAGKPLIAYTIEAAQQSTGLAHLFVSTDDAETAAIAEQHSVPVPQLRPAELAQDSTPTLPVIINTLDYLAETQGVQFDAVCILQPTSPFRRAGLIDDCVNDFIQSGADTLFTTVPVPDEFNPHWVFEPGENGNLRISTGDETMIPRRQSLPPAFIRDGCIYLIKTNILRTGTLYGPVIRGFQNSTEFAVNIDTQADWQHAEQVAAKYLRI